MKNLLSFLITQITGSSDFEIMDTEVEQETTLIVHATPAIVGLIIGKEGKTIKNLRRILSIRGVLEKKNVRISVLEK
jgi:predicted RNA-binding protein YlqC (UPF0109 family)